MANLRIGQPVVFEFKGKNQIGQIEKIEIFNKQRRYQVRAESGRLYPGLGIMTKHPGKILVGLSESYFAQKAVEDAKQILEIQDATAIDDVDMEGGYFGNVTGEDDEEV